MLFRKRYKNEQEIRIYFIHMRASRCYNRFTDVKRHKFIWREGIELQTEAKLVFPRGAKSVGALRDKNSKFPITHQT